MCAAFYGAFIDAIAISATPGTTTRAAWYSECERTVFKLEPSGLTWRLQCKGQLDMDVAGQFIFASPVRYSALITTKATLLDRIVQQMMVSIAAERIGACVFRQWLERASQR